MKPVSYEIDVAVRELVQHYSDLLDEGRIDELCEMFRHGDMVLSGVGQVFSGPEGIREMLGHTLYYDANGEPADPSRVYATTRAMHYVTNIRPCFGADGMPAATSKLLVVQQRKRDPCTVLGGRFTDAFIWVEDRLWFKRRVFEVHLVSDTQGYFRTNPFL